MISEFNMNLNNLIHNFKLLLIFPRLISIKKKLILIKFDVISG